MGEMGGLFREVPRSRRSRENRSGEKQSGSNKSISQAVREINQQVGENCGH